MNLKKIIKFKLGGELWEVPLGVLILFFSIAVLLMLLGAYFGFNIGENQFSP
ncbi:hypothetical protein [Pararhodonellum marinum]|uniref:hypothetical protein n=1 Tax=Pararhodonellum marinum TaxID=2755358 RepID=UPI00188ED3D2|nr:hypothetical protein [Pararhodonellum marinum]